MLPPQPLTTPLFKHCMTKSTHFHLLTPSPFISSGKIANPLFLISPPTFRGRRVNVINHVSYDIIPFFVDNFTGATVLVNSEYCLHNRPNSSEYFQCWILACVLLFPMARAVIVSETEAYVEEMVENIYWL